MICRQTNQQIRTGHANQTMNLIRFTRISNSLQNAMIHSAIAVAALLLAAPAARGELTMALTGDSTAQSLTGYGGEVDGYLFRTPPGTNLTVSWLGFYDKDGDGLVSEHLVRIWKAGGTWPVVASATIPAGTVDSLVGSFRGHEITPVNLEPDTQYVIAAPCFADAMREGDNLAGWGINDISILGGRYNDPPTASWGIMINANFGFTKNLSVLLTTPAAGQSYPSGSTITASANVGEPNIALVDTVTFHTTPINPAGPKVATVSPETSSPFTATLGVLPAGTYEIYATVANNDIPPGTATSATHTFTVAAAIPTTTTLATSGSPSTYGQCTLTATVSPAPMGGAVQFYDGGSPLSSPVAVNISTGEARLNANTLGADSHEITAEFIGYGVHTASTTATALTQVVEKAQLTVKSLNTLRAPNTPNPDPFPYQITGYQNGENLASSGVIGMPDLTTEAVPSSPPADYVITCLRGSLEAPNYRFAVVNGTLTVANVANTFSVNFYAYPGWMTSEEQRANLRVGSGIPAGFGDWYTSGWANIEVPWGGGLQPPVSLTSNQGSTATFTFKDCRNGWIYGSTARTTLLGDGNGNMMDGHVNSTLDPGDGSNLFDMEVKDIPFAAYDVIFYLGANEAQFDDGTGVIVFNGGAERAFTLKPGAFDGTFTEMIDATTQGNYIVFKGVTGSSFTTKTWGKGEDGFNHIGPFGFQIREVAVVAGYNSWAATNAPGQSPGQDFDNDGVKNGIEYFMGQTGSSFTAIPGPDKTNTVRWTMNPAYTGSYEVQTSPDLSTWTNVDPKPAPADGKVSYTLPPGLGTQFVRLLVTPTP
jgi:hypothetical protein